MPVKETFIYNSPNLMCGSESDSESAELNKVAP